MRMRRRRQATKMGTVLKIQMTLMDLVTIERTRVGIKGTNRCQTRPAKIFNTQRMLKNCLIFPLNPSPRSLSRCH